MDKTIKNHHKNDLLQKVRSKYILKQILYHLNHFQLMQIVRYNKKLQKLYDLKIDNYKKESLRLEIEVYPVENGKGKFINIRKGHEPYFKIYFNNKEQEVKTQKILKKDKVWKIKILIEYNNNAFYGLFKDCKCIKKIKFIKFNRTDITNMNLMFHGCTNLEELDLSKFRTDKVTKMFRMFAWCTSSKN